MQITTLAKVKHYIKRGYRTMRYDKGKYKWTGTIKDYIGREVENPPEDVLAVYAMQRADSEGKYVALMCILKEEVR